MKVEGVKEARKELLKLVRNGKMVLVTWHGRPRSVLLPLKNIRKLPRDLRMEFLRQSGRDIQDRFRKLGVNENRLLDEFESWRKARRATRRRR